ncbi:hypothetical protein [Raineyella sp. W15-4]|uniref:hypothetical protein n=1 Tax=Raineyella sp. W15-4 TaxID=3081651 RepID=UPI0029529E70|nr:hypothetical protein [Raineyella sp. W15-4]WOQ15638.1 hypothetical protein R0145_10340 [Raineyella sp. W15-4]
MGNPVMGGKVRNKILTYRNAAQGEHHLGADVTDLEFRVWHVLLSYADKDGCNARPGLDVLMTEARAKRRAVQYALRALEEKGAIVKTGGGYRGHASVYVVLPLPSATTPTEQTPRFGARQFRRINDALRQARLPLLSTARWLDSDEERVHPDAPNPPGKGAPGRTERVHPDAPHQISTRESAERPVAETVITGPADELDPPPSPEDEETFPEDRADTSGTPDDQQADSAAGVLGQGDNGGSGDRVAGSTSRDTFPVAADPTAPQDQGSRGRSTAVPLLDRSGQSTDECEQLNDERSVS